MQKKTCFVREVLFLFNSYFFKLGFSEGINTHVSLPFFFSTCTIAPLIIYFDLRLQNMFSKITISLLYYSISIFKILLQIFLLINSLLVLRNYISAKVLMVSCCQTKFWVLLPTMSKEYNHVEKDWN